VELSPDFVRIAKNNAREAGVKVNFIEGNTSNLPGEDNFFDFIICSAAFKNFKDPVKVLHEMHRVLKQGGTALIIDMNREATNKDIGDEIKGMKGFDKYFVKFSFMTFVKQGAYTKEEFEAFLKEIPFKDYNIKKEGLSCMFIFISKLGFKMKERAGL
jgi:ubiquinone/menaquinone biosynthesis C-methylase UbiE